MDPEPHLFGDYMYDANGTAIQYFPVKYPKTTDIGGVSYPVAYDMLELRVESNHGNPTYTCVYRSVLQLQYVCLFLFLLHQNRRTC